MQKNHEPVEKGIVILPAEAKDIAVQTMSSLGKPKPDTGKGTRIKKVAGNQYAVKLDGLPLGSKATFESYKQFGKNDKKKD